DTLLPQVAQRFEAINDPLQRSALAVAAFGRAGSQFLPVLHAIATFSETDAKGFEALHFTDAQIKASAEFIGQMTVLERVLEGVKNQIGITFAPIITPVLKAATTAILSHVDAIKDWANEMARNLEPVLKDVANLLAGNDAAVQNKSLIAA